MGIVCTTGPGLNVWGLGIMNVLELSGKKGDP